MRGALIAVAFALSGCAVDPVIATPKLGDHILASYYTEGTHTASGERYRPDGLTAAHPTLPMGSVVRVTNLRNNQSVVVRINDRGPARWTHRGIDLSRGAALRLDMIQAGVIPVSVEKVQ